MSFYTGNIANLTGYPPLTKNIFLWNTSLTTTYILSMYYYFNGKIVESRANFRKHKLGKHQRVRSRKIQRSGGLQVVGRPAWAFSSSVGFNLSWGDAPLNSKVESRELIKIFCTHSIKLSSLHCLRTSKHSSMGGGGVSALCGQRFWGAKRKKRKEKKEKKWWWKAPRFHLLH